MFAPAFAHHATARHAFTLTEEGEASYSETSTGSGEGGPDPFAQNANVSCQKHLDPALHRRVVAAAQAALGASCTKDANKRGMTQWSIAVEVSAKRTQCVVKTDTPAYAAFEKVLTEARQRVCARP